MSHAMIKACVLILMPVVGTAGPLHDAVELGDLDAAEELVSSGADINEIEYPSGAPLHIAARAGHTQLVKLLIASGAEIDSLEFVKDETPLHLAAGAGQIDVVSSLVTAGADIELPGNWGHTPLFKALHSGHGQTALRLIELGADIHAKTSTGLSTLHKAGEAGLWEVVDVLLSRGVGPDPTEDIKPLLPAADADRGAKLFEDEGCKSCHERKSGGAGDVGPPLENVVGREIASVKGFDYSEALTRLDGTWDYDALNRLLADASGYYPGIRMIVMGNLIEISDAHDRADLIEFLRVSADEPVPLP